MRPEASGNALDLSLIDVPLNQRESESMDPHIRGTGAGGAPTSESGSSSSASEPRRKNIPGLGSIYRRGDRWAIEFWKDGVQHRESARTSSEQEALAHLRKRVDEWAQNRYVGPRAERVTVKDLLALVTQDYATTGNRSRRTLNFRVAALEAELGHLRAVADDGPGVARVKPAQRPLTGSWPVCGARTGSRLSPARRSSVRTAVPRSTSTERTTCGRGSSVPRTIEPSWLSCLIPLMMR